MKADQDNGGIFRRCEDCRFYNCNLGDGIIGDTIYCKATERHVMPFWGGRGFYEGQVATSTRNPDGRCHYYKGGWFRMSWLRVLFEGR